MEASTDAALPRDAKESIIRIDHGLEFIEVWTEQRGLQAKLKKLGFKELLTQGRGVWYKGQPHQISFKRAVKRQGVPRTEAQRAALAIQLSQGRAKKAKEGSKI